MYKHVFKKNISCILLFLFLASFFLLEAVESKDENVSQDLSEVGDKVEIEDSLEKLEDKIQESTTENTKDGSQENTKGKKETFYQNAKKFDLNIAKEDTYVLPGNDGGFHLYIRARGDIGSVLLTETTQDPKLKLHNYAYRDTVFNEINGAEKRLLNGEPLDISKGLYSLIDSTVEEDTPLGKAFHIWIPHIVVYGYSWARSGELEVVDGTFINIRSFVLPYGDYEGAFKDNPFVLKIGDIMLNYIHEAVSSFNELTGCSGGKLVYAPTSSDIIPFVRRLVGGHPFEVDQKSTELDLMFVLDVTESMKSYIEAVKLDMLSFLDDMQKSFKAVRVGLILYKDYADDFVVKEASVFTRDFKKFSNILQDVKVGGGGDIPEAVYEGVFLGLRQSWRVNKPMVVRKLILIGDAPPHNKTRGKVKKEYVEKMAQDKKIEINTILLSNMPTK